MKWVIFFIVVLSGNVSAIMINEIMADPGCADKFCEWIELYNNDINSINISGWSIGDGDAVDSIENFLGNDDIIIPGKSFALIVDQDSRVSQNFNVGGNIIWIYVDDNAIGNGLSDNDEISLYDNNSSVIDNIVYMKVADGNTWALVNGDWSESSATPGKNNVNNESSNIDYSKVRINEFLPNPFGDDDASIPDGEWVELYNSGDEDLDLLGFKLVDNSNRDVIISDSTGNSTMIKSKDYLIVYMNGEFGFLNNDDLEIISFYDVYGNMIDNISYSNSREGVSYSLIDGFWKLSVPSLGNENLEDDISISYLRIENVYFGSDGRARFGDNLRVNIKAYKGDTGKYSVQLWVENKYGSEVSKRNRFNVYDKYVEHNLVMSVQLYSNCDNKYTNGQYVLVLDGINAPITKKYIDIVGITSSLCAPTYGLKTSKTLFTVIDVPSEIMEGSNFSIKIDLVNEGSSVREYELWSYVYRGSKSYSGNREGNKKIVSLPAESFVVINLENWVDEGIEEGDYKVKVKIKRSDRKTADEFRRDVKLLAGLKEEVENEVSGFESITGGVIYEGSSVKAERYGLWFFVLVLVGMICSLIYRDVRKV